MSVDNSAAGRLRDLPAGGNRAGRSALGVRSILGAFRRTDSGGRADPLRESTNVGMERATATQDQTRREEPARYEGKKLELEFHSLSQLRAEWQAVQSK